MLRCAVLVLCTLLAHQVLAEDQNVPIRGTDLTVAVPADWTITRTVPGVEFVLRGPPVLDPALDAVTGEHSRPSIAVSVATLGPSDTQASFAYRCYKDLERLLTGFHPFNFDFAYTFAGRKWQRIPYDFHTGQLEWEQELYVTSNGTTAICVTFSCDRSHFASWREQWDHVITMMSGSRPGIGDP